MFQKKYYYLVSGLSNIAFDSNKNLEDYSDFLSQMEQMLDAKDYELLKLFVAEADNRNLVNLLLENGKPFDTAGNFKLADLEEFVKYPDNAPAYMQTALQKFKNKELEADFQIEKQLLLDFYQTVAETQNSFVQQWFDFQLNVRNLLAALNCRKFDLPLEDQVVQTNDLAAQLLKNKSKDFGLSKQFPEIEPILKALEQEDIVEQERQLDALAWNKAEELSAGAHFAIENILSFALRLQLAHRWKAIEGVESETIFKDLVQNLQSGYQIAESF